MNDQNISQINPAGVAEIIPDSHIITINYDAPTGLNGRYKTPPPTGIKQIDPGKLRVIQPVKSGWEHGDEYFQKAQEAAEVDGLALADLFLMFQLTRHPELIPDAIKCASQGNFFFFLGVLLYFEEQVQEVVRKPTIELPSKAIQIGQYMKNLAKKKATGRRINRDRSRHQASPAYFRLLYVSASEAVAIR